MGYEITAIVGPAVCVEAFSEGLEDPPIHRLEGDLLFLPLTEEVYAQFAPDTGFDGPLTGLFSSAYSTTRAVEERAAAASASGPLMYMVADLYGGIGSQFAVVWEKGSPVIASIGDVGPTSSTADWPINTALKRLGVERAGKRDDQDEFMTIGLHRYRDMSDFADAGPNA